ncbi:tRNA methyltransferase complex GCD14 subunit [Xylariaceae sp. FL0594]|nr:tRNA methyltransferase complex GCD14 subunit [Xylariaceae sp. FL0594]
MSTVSPFLDPGPLTTPGALALIHLSRDNVQPVYLGKDAENADGYAEGPVINTRFGSFPHSTLINQPWGSQIRASVVDTGSRGRKRKAADADETENAAEPARNTKDVKTAASGFIHILPPTPEIWTASLPHRTQVVYTPDYSYILHRIRARPGMRIIEAGSGSGSFTHASARAVYNGYPESPEDNKRGKVWSFEFNDDRFAKMREEIKEHKLEGVVQVTHRNVYDDGFLVEGESPGAECVFLDLPAPWQALPHLARSKPSESLLAACGLEPLKETSSPWKSPLRPDTPVHICTFSPCIEQVTKTVDTMRRLGWMDIEMVEVIQRRVNVLREKVGLNMPSERGANQSPANVMEAITRLKQIDGRFKQFNNNQSSKKDADTTMEDVNTQNGTPAADNEDASPTVADSSSNAETSETTTSVKPWMAGRLIHRTEAEIKTHTSYLVFAVLPQEWTEEQEAAAFDAWPCGKEGGKVIGSLDKETRKQEKRQMLLGNKQKKKQQQQQQQEASNSGARAAKKTKTE